MSDTTVTTEAPAPDLTPASTNPLPNSTEARTPDGTLKDASSTTNSEASTNTNDSSSTSTTKDAKTDGPPEAYAEFKAPDGYTISKDVLDAAVPIFKEAGLSQDTAQKLVDFHVKQMLDAAKAPQTAFETMNSDWQKQTKDAFPGDKFETAKADIGKVLNVLPADVAKDFRSAMDITGAGNHPAVFKALAKLAEFVTEGKHVSGGNPSPLGQRAPGDTGRPSVAKALYPNNP